jgi:hypothetical protein
MKPYKNNEYGGKRDYKKGYTQPYQKKTGSYPKKTSYYKKS